MTHRPRALMAPPGAALALLDGPGAGLRRMLWSIMALLAPVACAEPAGVATGRQPGAVSASSVTAITLEQGCFGCTDGTVLVLQRDGLATLSTTGSARQGTFSRTRSGRVSAAEFQALAQQAVEQHFFDQPETRDDPQQRDGPWTIVRLSRDGQAKQVFWREGVAAPELASLTAAIKGVSARIAFGPQR